MKRLVLAVVLMLPLALLAGPSPTSTVSAPTDALLRPPGAATLAPVAVGTPDPVRKAPRASRSTPRPTAKATPKPKRYPRTSSGLNWAALRRCESGGDYTAVSKSGKYRGAYQFSYATWASVGGHGDPAAASHAEQDMRALMLYKRSGRGQWPECGRLL